MEIGDVKNERDRSVIRLTAIKKISNSNLPQQIFGSIFFGNSGSVRWTWTFKICKQPLDGSERSAPLYGEINHLNDISSKSEKSSIPEQSLDA